MERIFLTIGFILFCCLTAYTLKRPGLEIIALNAPLWVLLYLLHCRRLRQLEKDLLEASERLRNYEAIAGEELKLVEAVTQTVEAVEPKSLKELAPSTQSDIFIPTEFTFNSKTHQEVISFREIAHTVGRSFNLEETCELLVGKLRPAISFDACAIHLVDEVDGAMYPAHISCSEQEYFSDERFPIDEGVTGWVLAHARATGSHIRELESSYTPAATGGQRFDVIAAPLLREGVAFGVVSLYFFNRSSFTNEHLRLLEAVAFDASNAINDALNRAKTCENALADRLTELPNSRSLHLLLEQRLAECLRQKDSTLAVLYLDLNDFTGVNEQFGYGVGDRLIAEVSQVIKAQLRQMDMLARYEADEFVAVLPTASAGAAQAVTDRIHAAIESYRFTVREGLTLQVGISIGVANFPSHGETVDQILRSAREDMPRTKPVFNFGSRAAQLGSVVSLDSYR